MTREERQAAIETGSALMEQGYPRSFAAKAVGLPATTLFDGLQKLADDPDAMKRSSDRVAAANLTIAERAAEYVYNGLETATYDQQMRAWGIASDKVAMHQGWGSRALDASAPSIAADAAARMLQALEGRSITLTVSKTEPDAITLEHEPVNQHD